MDVKEIINRVGYARAKAGFSARDLSLRIEKNDAYISRLGTKNKEQSFEPSISVLLDIISACGMKE